MRSLSHQLTVQSPEKNSKKMMITFSNYVAKCRLLQNISPFFILMLSVIAPLTGVLNYVLGFIFAVLLPVLVIGRN